MSTKLFFSHVVFKTFNLPKMKDWYMNIFDARVAVEPDGMAKGMATFLAYDSEHHRIGISQLPGPPPQKAQTQSGVSHVAYKVADARSLLKRYVAMREQGVRPAVTVNHGLTLSFYYEDPDQNIVEFFADCFKTEAESNVFMKHPVFVKNTVGVEVDPEELARKMEAGASESELLAFDIEKADRVDPVELMVRTARALHSL